MFSKIAKASLAVGLTLWGAQAVQVLAAPPLNRMGNLEKMLQKKLQLPATIKGENGIPQTQQPKSDGKQGGDIGNGGNGNEAVFSGIARELLDWVNKNEALGSLDEKLNLNKNGVEASTFTGEFGDAVSNVNIQFTDEAVTIDNVPRTCVNFQLQALIRCQNGQWDQTDVRVRYAVVFHEYLGYLGYESNDGDYSRYPISSQILSFLFSTQKYEIGMQRQPMSPSVILGSVVKKDASTQDYCKNAKFGDVCKMDQYTAELYCGSLGSRLPSVKELALFLSPQGVSETQRDGFIKVESRGEPAFFYTFRNYHAAGDKAEYWLWSSSIIADDKDSAYYFNSSDEDLMFHPAGEIDRFTRLDHNAVRCVK